MFAAVFLATITSILPLRTTLENCRKGIRETQTREPSLRRVLKPLEFDLQIEPRLHPGISPNNIVDLVGFLNANAYDFIYPITFENRFHPLPWITRISSHEGHIDTRFVGPSGEGGLLCHWDEVRRYYLTIFPGAAVPLVEIPVHHFGQAWPLPENYSTFYPPGSYLPPETDNETWKKAFQLRDSWQAKWIERSSDWKERIKEAKLKGIDTGPIQLAPFFRK